MANGHQLRIEAGGISLAAAVHLPPNTPAPVIICCHGLLSYKDSPKYLEIGKQMSDAGFCVLRFDFSGCGQSAQRQDSLIGARKRDLEYAMAFARTQPWSDGRVGLLGSSLGGFLSVLAAEENPESTGAVVSWAAPFDLSRLDRAEAGMDELARLFPGGLRLGEPKSLNHIGAAKRVLLVHGRQDEVVPWKASIEIYRRIKDPKELVVMRNADHRFMDDSLRQSAIKLSLDWFSRYL